MRLHPVLLMRSPRFKPVVRVFLHHIGGGIPFRFGTDIILIIYIYLVLLAISCGLSTDCLPGIAENRNRSNADLTDLHLSGGMIALLKGEKSIPPCFAH